MLLVPLGSKILKMRKRWQQQAAASRLAKSPRADKRGSGSADSAEAGANKASLVDKAGDRASEPPLEISDPYSAEQVLEGSRGKVTLLMSVQTRLPWGLELGTLHWWIRLATERVSHPWR